MAYSVKCECGRVIEGLSESQMNFNLQTHKKSKKHKDLMKRNKQFRLAKIGGGEL